MIISIPQHATTVCLFHAGNTRTGYLWPEQRKPAARIRERCGWLVQMRIDYKERE